MSGGRAERHAHRPESAVLTGAGLPSLAVGALVVAGSAAWGRGAVAGSAVGVGLALAALAIGPLVQRTSSRWSPPAVMAAALGVFAVTVGLLAVALALLGDAGWLSGGAVGVGLVVTTTVWMLGHLRAAGRLRVLVFGEPPEPGGDGDIPGHVDSSESSGRSSH